MIKISLDGLCDEFALNRGPDKNTRLHWLLISRATARELMSIGVQVNHHRWTPHRFRAVIVLLRATPIALRYPLQVLPAAKEPAHCLHEGPGRRVAVDADRDGRRGLFPGPSGQRWRLLSSRRAPPARPRVYFRSGETAANGLPDAPQRGDGSSACAADRPGPPPGTTSRTRTAIRNVPAMSARRSSASGAASVDRTSMSAVIRSGSQ
jgi:hypothetical protein